MRPEILLEHFDRINEAPDAVPRLRRFILDLAVRGKLVEQDPKDEPAAELLKRIQTEKARLIKEGKAGKQEPFQALTNEQAPFVIPSTWMWVPATFPAFSVSDLGKKIQTKDVMESGEFPVIDQGKVFIRGYCNDSSKVIRVKSPIILFGDHTRETKLIDFDFVVGADGVKLLHPVYIQPNYYYLALQWLPLDNRGYGRHFKLLRAAFLPLPPLAEQHRIVAKVDELMALCDQLESARNEREARRNRLVAASLNRVSAAKADEGRDAARFHLAHLPRLTTRPAHIKQLRQTILDLAVRGRLVPQDPNNESTNILLESIRAEQHNSIKSGLFKPRTIIESQEKGDSSYPVPTGWCWITLADLITFGPQNGVSPKEIKDKMAPKALTLTSTTSGFFNGAYYKHVDLSQGDCEPYWLSPGDLLFQRGNTREYVGMAAIFDGPEKTFVFPDLMIRVRLSRFLEPHFIHMVLISPLIRQYFSREATGASTTMPKINQKVLLNTPIPLPPLAEQHRIVAKVDELMALCDQLETQLTATEADSRRLLEAVLRDALAPAHESAIA